MIHKNLKLRPLETILQFLKYPMITQFSIYSQTVIDRCNV